MPDYNCVRIRQSQEHQGRAGRHRTAMHIIQMELLSRPSSTPPVAARGVAMQVEYDLSRVECYIFSTFGHLEED